ncbi:hypothetical protein [Actinocatenispora rupis]|uniref:Tissue inhibitor of metalloproteinase n=1 Tax=Actinocatenispora rupis TaxID=519421 RepID=A0A8J3NDQ8_9ACTN|nr:hypothetical protein [Actinocatenispora rupis]GID11774.1 hypothetical protein Aru02nite_26630 [Actinocatenispora rupis]
MRIRAIAVIAVLIGAVGALGVAAPCAACSCADVPVAELTRTSTAVFSGTVRDVTDVDDVRLTTFAVGTVYRGAVHRTEAVASGTEGASCGLEVVPGRRYTVFVRRDAMFEAPTYGARFAAGLCDVRPGDVAPGPGRPPLAGANLARPPARYDTVGPAGLGAGLALVLLALPATLAWRGRRP